MRLTKTANRPETNPRWMPYAAGAAAVATAAVVGSRAVDPNTDWYQRLDKPAWQPPPWAFGAVWTPLYLSIAWAAGHALQRTHGRQRQALATTLGTNLALIAAWNWMFFGCRSPKAGVLGTLLLDASNVLLIRRTARADAVAAQALVPYAGWCAFATALNWSIARRNR
ncbi:TspO/MBR family protein [Streptomyces sp. NPDC005202]|uniref:TspO/MBR family protein n=1 Tax=Streptomyces sp. NPDC005202 TaxID=3157021 RepID=UPI0033A39CA1